MLFDDGLGVRRALVLPVEVVRVLPDVDDEKRLDAGGSERRVGVRRRFDGELYVLRDEPCPAAAEALDSGVRKRGPARVERSERRVDRGLERDRRFAALSFRRERFPVEVVVPRLRRVVEDGGVSRRPLIVPEFADVVEPRGKSAAGVVTTKYTKYKYVLRQGGKVKKLFWR